MTARILTAGLRPRPLVDPILGGAIDSSRLRIEARPRTPYTDTFRAMVREDCYDIAEMPLATQLLAAEAGLPLMAMPVILAGGGLPHLSLLCQDGRGVRGADDLAGRRIGIRSYAQTTGVWVRGILQNDYGLDLSSLHWKVLEDSHLPDFVDPGNVSAASSSGLRAMLEQGEVDAVVSSPRVLKDVPGLRPVLQDAQSAGEAWRARHGLRTVNHVLSLRRSVADDPDLVAEIARMFTTARAIAQQADDGSYFPPFGAAANRPAVELMLDYAAQQGLSARRWTYQDLFLPWPEQVDDAGPRGIV